MWPYEQYTVLENFLFLFAVYIPILILYWIVRPILYRYAEKKHGPIEKGTDVPHAEYWADDTED